MNPETTPLIQKEKVLGDMMLGIKFKRGYNRWNFLGTFVVLLAGFTAMIYLNTQTIFLLRDPNGFNVPKNEIGRVSNELIAFVLPF